MSRKMGWKYYGGLLLDVEKRFALEKKFKKESAATKVFRVQKSAL